MRNILLITLSFCFWGLEGIAQDNSWDKRANFGGLKRERAVAFSVGEFGYVGTGIDTAENIMNDLWRFDPSENVWAQMSTLPAVGRRNAVAFAIGDKGYIGTGVDSEMASLGNKLNDFWEYTPATNTWLQKADYPGGGGFGVYYGTAFAIDDRGFVCAGKIGADNYVFDLWEYNPTADTWTARTSFPGGDRYGLSSFAVNGKGYVGMGTDHDLYRKDWWEYDPATFTWTAKADLPGAERNAASTFTLGQRGFVVFGTDGGYSDELWEYNPFTDSWNIKAPFPPEGRKGGIAFSIGDTGYAGTGKNASGKKQSFYAYVPGVVSVQENYNIEFSVFPNPIIDQFQVNVGEELLGGRFKLTSLTGQIIWSESITSTSSQFIRPESASGYYVLEVTSDDQNIKTSKTLFFK